MKTICFCFALVFIALFSVRATAQEASPAKVKKDQANLPNEVYLSYGTGTIYYFIEGDNGKADYLSGAFTAGYCRALNRVVAVGFQLSYTCIGRSDNMYYSSSSYAYTSDRTENLWQGIANVRFRYLNTPTFSMYSGVGMGVTMNYYSETNAGVTETGQSLMPAGQLTLLGFRVGRSLSFFGEFGVGTQSILNAGISYKFSD